MSRITRKALQESILLKRLCIATDSENSSQSHPHDFVGKFNRLADQIAPQLTETNLLFPEFTPHDEANHISSLFRLTDELLGPEVINNLNACECFLLSASLYGHDWGMAVSQNERLSILSNSDSSEISRLENENESITKFASQNGIELDAQNQIKYPDNFPDELWRNYVRLTHAERANVRIIALLENEGDRSLAEALGRLCASHWFDIKDVRILPQDYSVAGWIVNLRILSAFLRIIDMFDIASNRTPYKLWKFKNPQNDFSALEWKKHDAINPITTTQESKTTKERKILIHGSTTDYKVFAAVRDLQSWCDEQFSENREILIQESLLNPHLSKTEWKIETSGFEPIDIRFEFDRNQMFEMLSTEIYDGDPYVFLRELVQNSHDAIKLRSALIEKDRPDLSFNGGQIDIDVQHGDNGDATISISDNGIGMEKSIIKNYLSRIGTSYYTSSEFNHKSLKMNPISRFGVGILSCFMVADKIEIETQQDPLLADSTSYQIEISDYKQQFRIIALGKNTFSIGTKITVYIKGKKYQSKELRNHKLDVTEYLAKVVGSISSEISITENGVTSLLTQASLKSPSNNNQHLVGIKYALDVSKIFEPQDQPYINQFLQENIKEIDQTINGIKIRGALAYYTLHDNIYVNKSGSHNQKGANVYSKTNQKWRLRWNSIIEEDSYSPSAQDSIFGNLFLNGILVPEAKITIPKENAALPLPKVTLMINSSEIAPTLSRRGIRASVSLSEIATALYDQEIRSLFFEKFMSSNPRQRFEILGEILTCFHIDFDRLRKIFPIKQWPVITLSENPDTQLQIYGEIKTEKIFMPEKYSYDHTKDLQQGWGSEEWLNQPLNYTSEILEQFKTLGSPRPILTSLGDLRYGEHPWALQRLQSLFNDFFTAYEGSTTIHTVSYSKRTCLAKLTSVSEQKPDTTELNDISKEFFGSLSFSAFSELENAFCLIKLSATYLLKPDDELRTSNAVININHPFGKQLTAAIIKHKELERSLEPLQNGSLMDIANDFPLKSVSVGYDKHIEIAISRWAINYINQVSNHGALQKPNPTQLGALIQPGQYITLYE